MGDNFSFPKDQGVTEMCLFSHRELDQRKNTYHVLALQTSDILNFNHRLVAKERESKSGSNPYNPAVKMLVRKRTLQ